ncbi:hypothetical protein NP233_g6173 [Leucocoprinus birnbaumii]|uniref:Uncharacterized protein n=1 Tax=Leucocoprinus birnbaumii TaxID=56174 RepID=A0AAD5VRH0_9AGAR|nr:hypothetical protein NP233_g6173 [Leucocoprinus birnbaumii]
MLAIAALCFSFFISAALSSPLLKRDVVDPHITNPHEGTVWVVGSKELVTWETDNLPPPSQITNLMGRVILGFQANNNHPLAQNFKITDGNVSITVPNVPPRDDYIIVLMGDSGNSSPAFAITSIRNGSTTNSTTTGDNSPPITGGAITGGASSATSSNAPTSSAATTTPVSTPTSPISLPSSGSSELPSLSSLSGSSTSSGSATLSGSAAAAATSNSAAWSVHTYSKWTVIAVPLAFGLLI